ncbi:sigma-70 family RNA polymerase sigma factor [Vannielia litorea]|uniref:sigma-70 family RNA polymerase sigma factor n=1 Tax=Vannielia TaxID=2813041 RepID=UPI001C96AE40|nr:sigma-70 family RNA polymerase sigma factor [Vannielia litorea]MBY6046358.1 sigma-70 family RNA polymerase sigma factor [Vannielia litorea]MBY6073771.1 sigma-70 family RNA polymerase sigma factor [Vannielia litorea]MBY6153729.1 sigma-70 family RNA polymerase sigma factor [Vannielia litorea]
MATSEEIEGMIARCALGDRAAFAALYQATSSKLFGICLRILRERSEAEDALQEVYLRVWRKAESYVAGGPSPMAWLSTVTRNLAIDRLRAKAPPADELEDAPELVAKGPTPEQSAVAAGEAARIGACLGELEPDRAGAVRGAYLEGASYTELAGHYGVPLNTMRTWLRRSLIKLKECLER